MNHPINHIPLTIARGICPHCGKYVKVEDRKFVPHKDLQRKPCPRGGQPIPEEWR